MSETEHDNERQPLRYVDGVPILPDFGRQLSEVERKQDEAERHRSQYEAAQIKLTGWLVAATIALAISTVALGGIQIVYMHRQWKLTSDGLSKAGDQIWAAKNAAFAAQQAANTSNQMFGESKRQFDQILGQMKSQTRAQQNAANTARSSLESIQRAFVYVDTYDMRPIIDDAGKTDGMELTPHARNSGSTQAIASRYFIGTAPQVPTDFSGVDSKPGIRAFFPPQFSGNLTSTPGHAVFEKRVGQIQTLVSYGWIKYQDVFKGTPEHVTKFCNVLQVYFPPPPDDRPASSWVPCDSHNCVDKECKK